ncbi:MAG: THUMP domain-containing class I SAM-dependent methyltransferase [Candidatus Woesearchaeota archaeon]
MKCIAFCALGFEDILLNDIQEILNIKAKKETGCCIFEATKEKIAKFAFVSQSIEKIGVLLKEGIINDIPEIDISDVEFEINNTFFLDCSINGIKPFKSNDVQLYVSNQIIKKTKKKAVYKNPGILYNIEIIGKKFYLTINLSSKELYNRDYKVFANKNSLRGTIAYSVTRIADVKKKDKILDPFCRSGEIGIELIHYFLGKSVHHYAKDKFTFNKIGWNIELSDNDKKVDCEINLADSSMPNIKASEKNAKIAGINKFLNFSRIQTEDLDLKYENIDKIITQLPVIGKETKQKVIKIYRYFFEVTKKILKKDGKIICIGNNIDAALEIAEQNDYKLIHQREVMQGKELMKVYIFETNRDNR